MSSPFALTGGTYDVNPQALKVRVTATAPSTSNTPTYGQVGVQIPIQRLGNMGAAQVLEILGYTVDGLIGSGTASLYSYKLTISSRAYGTTAAPSWGNADPYVIHQLSDSNGVARLRWYFGANVDLTDKAGHGVLFGGDNVYVQLMVNMETTGTGVTPECNLNIWYRFKNVGLNEFISLATMQ